jgi:peptide deformylase
MLNRIFTQLFNSNPEKSPRKLLVYQVGNPVLRKIAEPIANVRDREIQQLIAQMLITLKESKGVGLAAPQIGRSLQLVIIASHPNQRYPNAPTMLPTVMINPTLISGSDEIEKGWEGCLSVPMIRGLVPRYRQIEIAYTDPQGDRQNAKLTDFVARIFQHEYDHLQGKVFLDRVETNLDLVSESEYYRILGIES